MTATLKTTVTAGLFLRGQFRRRAEEVCHILDISLIMKENKGLLESSFLISAEGNESEMRRFIEWLEGIAT